MAAHLAGGWAEPTHRRRGLTATKRQWPRLRFTVPYVNPNDTMGQLHHHLQFRPRGHHRGVAVAILGAGAAVAADTCADDTSAAVAAADTAAAYSPLTFPVSLSLHVHHLCRQVVHRRLSARVDPSPPFPPYPVPLPSPTYRLSMCS